MNNYDYTLKLLRLILLIILIFTLINKKILTFLAINVVEGQLIKALLILELLNILLLMIKPLVQQKERFLSRFFLFFFEINSYFISKNFTEPK